MSEAGASQNRSGGATRAPNEPLGRIEVQVNGEPLCVTSPCTIRRLLEVVELAGKRVAVAVNRDVVIRSRYGDVELRAGDRVEILEAVGGG